MPVLAPPEAATEMLVVEALAATEAVPAKYVLTVPDSVLALPSLPGFAQGAGVPTAPTLLTVVDAVAVLFVSTGSKV